MNTISDSGMAMSSHSPVTASAHPSAAALNERRRERLLSASALNPTSGSLPAFHKTELRFQTHDDGHLVIHLVDAETGTVVRSIALTEMGASARVGLLIDTRT